MVRCYGYAFCHVIGRILGTRWRHVLPCYTCLSETLDVFYIKNNVIICLPASNRANTIICTSFFLFLVLVRVSALTTATRIPSAQQRYRVLTPGTGEGGFFFISNPTGKQTNKVKQRDPLTSIKQTESDNNLILNLGSNNRNKQSPIKPKNSSYRTTTDPNKKLINPLNTELNPICQ